MATYREVQPLEAPVIAPALAALHLGAHDSGMALGLLAPQDPNALTRAYVERAADPDRPMIVAEFDGEVVGMAQLAPSGADNAMHRAEVQRVAVAASARGTGIGRGLMEAVEEVARARGLTLLWLTTHAGSEAAKFYEAIGYTELGVMPGYSRRPDGTLWPGAFYYREL